MTRIHAHARATAQIRRSKAEQRGETVTMRGVNKIFHPIAARIGAEGVEWEDNMRKHG